MPCKSSMKIKDYNDLLQDYVCSCAIRVARDIFALLPVSHVIVHALSEGITILSVDFERRIFTKLRFKDSDASDLVEEFKYKMIFDSQNGFQPGQISQSIHIGVGELPNFQGVRMGIHRASLKIQVPEDVRRSRRPADLFVFRPGDAGAPQVEPG